MKAAFLLLFILLTIELQAQDRWEKLPGPAGAVITALTTKGDTLIIGAGLFKALIFFSTNRGNDWLKADFKTTYINSESRINDFVFSDDGGIITSVYRNGLYKSYDLTHWENILNNNEAFWGLGKDYNGILYAGTDNGGIYMSQDYGTTWNPMVTGASEIITSFLLTKDNSLLAGNYMKVLKKLKNANNWLSIDFNNNNYLRLFAGNGDTIFANNNSQLYLSTDNGDSWRMLDTSHFFYNTYVYGMIYNNRLIGGCSLNEFQPGWGIILSDDYGETWRYSHNGLPPEMTCSYLTKSGNDTYVGTCHAGIFKSTDYGENWSPCNNGIYAAQTLDIIFDKDETLYAACWSNGIYKSTDYGYNWRQINNGLTNVNLYTIIKDINGVFLAGTDHGVFRSTDKGEHWIRTAAPGNDFCFSLFKDKRNRIYSLSYGDGIYRTTDLGDTWQEIDNGFASSFVFGFAIDSSNNIYAGTRSGYIYKSTNDGISWTQLRNSNNIYNSVIVDMVIAPNGNIFATNLREGVLRSTDNGATWAVKNNGLNSLMAASLNINSNGEIYMATQKDDKFYYSSDNGESWHDILSNLTYTTINQIRFDKHNNIFLATDESVWRNADAITPVEITNLTAKSENNSVKLEWTTATEVNNYGFTVERKPLSSTQWTEIAFIKGAGSSTSPINYTYTDSKITPAKYSYRLKQTDNNGSYKYYYFNTEITITGPAKYSLNQNYPNPFNPNTTIRYSIKDAGLVKIEIFDILGRKVATIVNEEKPMGEYEVNFNSNNLSSGIYFYRLTTGSFTQIRKMQLIK